MSCWLALDDQLREQDMKVVMAELQDHSLRSKFLGERRNLTVFVPKVFRRDARSPVIVCADGQFLSAMFRTLAHEMDEGPTPPCVLIGIHSTQNRTQEFVLESCSLNQKQ